MLSVALATSAGCFGKDDGEDGDAPPTTTTPTTTTPVTTTPGGAGNNTNNTPTTPVALQPLAVCTVSFNFQNNVQPGPPPTEISTADCGSVPAGYRTLALSGNFTAGTPPVTGALTVDVLDSAGTVVATCSAPQGAMQAPVPCSNSGTAAPGAYTLRFTGVGGAQFAGEVIAS